MKEKLLKWCFRLFGFPIPKVDIGSVWVAKSSLHLPREVTVTDIEFGVLGTIVVEYRYKDHEEYGLFDDSIENFVNTYRLK